MATENIRVVVFQEGTYWVAQCLEYDIGVQAQDLDSLHSLVSVAINAELTASVQAHNKPFAGIEPAPKHFHDMWEKRARSFPSGATTVRGDSAHAEVELGLCA